MQSDIQYNAGLYCRLSKDDDRQGESVSIETQREMLTDYCRDHNFNVTEVYVDDGYSGLNFNRPGFQKLLEDVELGLINMVITKDLSRLGRDYIMTGYYSDIFFPMKGIRYIAISDNFDSIRNDNDIAPFKNILNDMYAKDISRKVKNAKQSRARQGRFIGPQPPYGYSVSKDGKRHLVADPEAAETVQLIFSLAETGLGEVAITRELRDRCIVAPSVYKYRHGDTRFENFPAVRDNRPYEWSSTTVGAILVNRVYLGELTSLKTETANYKSKKRVSVPEERRIVTPNAHEAIISQAQFDRVQQIRSLHQCPAYAKRDNLFRGLLFCECCGHPLTISRKQLLYREADIYFCISND